MKPTLAETAETMKRAAKVSPGGVARVQLRGKLHISLVLEGDQWRLCIFRYEQEPSVKEIEVCLREFNAPSNLSPTGGEKLSGDDGYKGSRFFWPAFEQPALLGQKGGPP